MHEGQQLVGGGSTDLKFRLAAFSRYFGSRPIAAITVEELDNWLRALPGSPKSRANFRANISVLFGHAMRRRMIDTNPILHTGRPTLPGNPPEIFTVDELRALLEAAAAQAPDVLPMLAIGAFAGLRDAEIKRWPNNGLRHSFASYRLAACHDAPRVASELGHTSPQMLYNTYRELVLPDEAERYWRVVPQSGEATNVVSFATSANR